ncbi:hypothetical protein T484DRAFT_1891392 [Baffinella frigidus]|nr:hypothetical protein T484DRAFT_1891392 [Cryptophyta sp. CCMP2293]
MQLPIVAQLPIAPSTSLPFLKTLASTVATTAMLMPIVAQLSVAINVSPEAHMIACTWASSYSFMLPISTPPNAIAFATKAITAREMLLYGSGLTALGCILTTAYVAVFFRTAYGHDPFECPAWACA